MVISGLEIRKKRKELGLTQKQLAEKIGISFQSLNGYENGKKIPSTKYQILDKILNQINVFETEPNTQINNLIEANKNLTEANKSLSNAIETLSKKL